MKAFGVLSLVFFAALGAQAQSKAAWRITQPTWTEAHERQFGEFVNGIGMAVEQGKCWKVDDCLKSSANPYYKSDPVGLRYFSDCADLPYYLRGYFAWKNGLPFSVVSQVTPSLNNGEVVKDIRYSPNGNSVARRFDILSRYQGGRVVYANAFEVLNNVVPDYTSSATFRMSGTKDSANLFSDFYPVAINRQGVRPGTAIYDPNGHVAIIYRVAGDGRVFYIDAHPDNSLTRGMFTPKFARSKPGQGAGFKNFRPLTIVGAQKDSTGAYIGGRIVGTLNQDLPNYGTAQFFGTQPDPGGAWNKGKFVVKGQVQAGFHDYVRMSLTQGDIQIDPLDDMSQLVDDICVSLKDRVAAVNSARSAGIDSKPHPVRLPENIYGTSGEWEEYSSPSRDARLKVSFMDLLAQTKSNVTRFNKKDPAIRYDGGNLGADLFAVYAKKAQECIFSYTTTNGQEVRLNLEAARQRLFNMSFDPYHCIELRWGARLPQEMASCQDDSNKRAWYEREQWLRNQSERRYDARMDFTLNQLTGPLPNVGVATAPDVDIVGYLKSIR